jgi:hypothetical protein
MISENKVCLGHKELGNVNKAWFIADMQRIVPRVQKMKQKTQRRGSNKNLREEPKSLRPCSVRNIKHRTPK